MGKLTLTEAVQMMEKINESNKNKRPYVGIKDRGIWEWEVEDKYILRSHVNVYSKTWSRRVSRLYNTEGELPRWFNLAEAKRLLKVAVLA
jgi:6-phosphogluconolactonase (cycloisomerase 2 family)